MSLDERESRFIAHCKYYNGEESSPFEDSSNKSLFWQCEKMYVEKSSRSTGFHQFWIEFAKEYIRTHPNEKNILTSDTVSIETKGIILYSEEMLRKWVPYNVDAIFDY